MSRAFITSPVTNFGIMPGSIGLVKPFASSKAEHLSLPYKAFDMRMDFWAINFSLTSFVVQSEFGKNRLDCVDPELEMQGNIIH